MSNAESEMPTGAERFDLVEIEDEVLDSSTKKFYSTGQLVLHRFLRHRAAMISVAVLAITVIIAFTSVGFAGIPGWWKYDWSSVNPIYDGGHPTLGFFHLGEHPLGQDTIGKDYFALVMRGTQNSIIIAVIVGAIGTIIGTVIGAAAGYFRGWIEAVLMRLTDVFIVIPLLVLAAVIGQITGGKGVFYLAFFLGVLSWTGLARMVRGEALSLREREFVAAAQAVGARPWRIVLKHILPNCLGTIIVNATLLTSAAILLETGLSYLGFGVRAPDTSLGLLISQYQNSFSTRPWLFFGPAGLILIITLTINFIGDGLRDAFDPRQKGKQG